MTSKTPSIQQQNHLTRPLPHGRAAVVPESHLAYCSRGHPVLTAFYFTPHHGISILYQK